MALDNAQFISELSITDPPGTDAVAEGDDHIRTTKRATQQSFPNIDAAVPQTAAQMGQMAIKNEVNAYTQQQQFADGTALLPSLAFASAIDMGMFQASGILRFAVSGAEQFQVSATSATFQQRVRAPDGSAALPAWAFSNNTNMGMYRAGSNVLAFAAAGSQVATMTLTEFQYFASFRGVPGVDADAAYGFQAAPSTGMSRGAGGALNFAVDGIRHVSYSPTGTVDIFQVAADFQGNVDFQGTSQQFPDDRMFFQATAEPSPTARVGFSLKNNAGTRFWETYMTNGGDYNLCQRRVGGTFQDNPITITNADGLIVMVSLPTTNPGRNGALWKSSGFVAVSSG